MVMMVTMRRQVMSKRAAARKLLSASVSEPLQARGGQDFEAMSA